ncbi:MAG TPA: sulfurtransferase TusA family protein [Candidatus Limnocylindrales bacterium]|jgi:tRNA 2-thiouridine synthesizing protein A|nr:sulfurtransferase TusA family protein [Candidatus Limnocylindrales bacterium]
MSTSVRQPINSDSVTLDARGLKCPMPIVRTAQKIKDLSSGQLLEVLATDPGAVADFAAWSRATGNEIVSQSTDDGVYRFVIRHR